MKVVKLDDLPTESVNIIRNYVRYINGHSHFYIQNIFNENILYDTSKRN